MSGNRIYSAWDSHEEPVTDRSFLGTFYLIRSAFGGYHAETSPVCMLVSYGGWGAVMILSRYMEAYAEVPLVLWIVLAADLCVFAILGRLHMPISH